MITADGTELKISTQGRSSGRGAILLHGLAGAPSVWSDTAPALAPRFKVILPAHRGHAGSGAGVSPTVNRLASDVFEVCDEFSLPASVLIGHGLGATVAMVAAAESPERVDALILVGSAATPLNKTSGWAKTRERAAGMAIRSGMGEAWEVYLESGVFGVSPEDVPTEIIDRWRSEFVSVDPVAYSTLAQELAIHDDVASPLRDLGIPTLVVCGTDDQPYSDRAEELAKLSSAELEWIAGGGHTPQLARAELFNEVVVAFLRRALPPKS